VITISAAKAVVLRAKGNPGNSGSTEVVTKGNHFV